MGKHSDDATKGKDNKNKTLMNTRSAASLLMNDKEKITRNKKQSTQECLCLLFSFNIAVVAFCLLIIICHHKRLFSLLPRLITTICC